MADNKGKTWDNLTKDYLTTDQKLDIIREHNRHLSKIEWDKGLAALKDYLEKRKDE